MITWNTQTFDSMLDSFYSFLDQIDEKKRRIRLAFYMGENGGLIDHLICIFSGGKYSHVELFFENGLSFSSSHHKPHSGTHFRKVDDVLNGKPEDWDFVDLWVSYTDYNTILEFCNKEDGCKYDWRGVILFDTILHRPSPSRWFCSEVVTTALQEIDLLKCLIPVRTSPTKLAEFVRYYLDEDKSE